MKRSCDPLSPSHLLSLSLCLCLSFYLCSHPFVHLSIYLSIQPSIYLPIYLSISPSVYLFIYLSIHQSIDRCLSSFDYVRDAIWGLQELERREIRRLAGTTFPFFRGKIIQYFSSCVLTHIKTWPFALDRNLQRRGCSDYSSRLGPHLFGSFLLFDRALTTINKIKNDGNPIISPIFISSLVHPWTPSI